MTYRWLIAAAALVFAIAVFWPGLSGEPDFPDFGSQVDEQYNQLFASGDFVQSDPATFFANGGTYCDEEEYAPFDTPHVLPLLERLAAKLGLEWTVVSEAAFPKDAIAIYATLPEDVTRDEVIAELVREQKTFPGDIFQQWGNTVISLEFTTPEERAEDEAEDAADGDEF